jgi:PTS system nitrogen regulatory IIA component
MTTRELAQYLRLNETTIYKYAAKGTIPAIRIGRNWRFEKGVIERWVTEGSKNANTHRVAQKGDGVKDNGLVKARRGRHDP